MADPVTIAIFFLCILMLLITLIVVLVEDLGYGAHFFKKNKAYKKLIYALETIDEETDKIIWFFEDLTSEIKRKIYMYINNIPLETKNPEKDKKLNIDQRQMKVSRAMLKHFERLDAFFEARERRLKRRRIMLYYFGIISSSKTFTFFRSHYRNVVSTLNGFKITDFGDNMANRLQSLIENYLVGIYSLYYATGVWILPYHVSLLSFFCLSVYRGVPFPKTIFIWCVVGMFAYWLISGFVSFIKKYQYSKFTSAIQRFWRRSYILFWLIEFSLFSVFFYLTLNSNNESWYMYDQLQVLKTGLFSWRSFFMKLFPLTLLIICGYLLMLSFKWNVFTKHTPWLLILTIVLIYTVWLEFYQFFHAVNFYGNFNWVYDIDEKVWSLELEIRKSRTINHYVMLMIMLKFWHIIVIFIIWVFFLLRVLEIGRIRYPLFSANLQNFIILYLFAWVLMFPWLKFIFRKYLDMPYYWFYVNNRRLGIRSFFGDVSLYYYSLVNFIYYYGLNFNEIFDFDFFYFSPEDEFFSARKTLSRDLVLSDISPRQKYFYL